MDNRKRALSEVVSLEAWHQQFKAKRKAVKLFVDVVFSEGRVGGSSDPVRFRLRIKQAEVVVVIPPTEQASIDKTSVAREAPLSEIKSVEEEKSVRKTTAKAKADLNARHTLVPSVTVGAEGHKEGTRSSHATRTRSIPAIQVMQTKTPEGQYAWQLRPGWGQTLLGRPWSATSEPRLKVIDKRADSSRGLEPSVRVEVRCRREDLDITDIRLSADKGLVGKFSPRRNKEVAAEALIRSRLFEAGLFHSTDLSDPFAEMVLCATTAETSYDE